MRMIGNVEDNDGSSKLAWDVGAGRVVETAVFNATAHRPALHAGGGVVCISSQVGCNVGCRFCASGRLQRLRNLTTDEMVHQATMGRQVLGEAPASVTFSGIGEPLQNLSAVAAAADELCDRHGFRYASLSTIGIPQGIRKLGKRRPTTHLFLSLHATTDRVRESLIPSPACFPIAEVVASAADYADRTGRQVKVSYLLLRGVNDTPEDASRLGSLLDSNLFAVQILLWNAVPHLPFVRTSDARAEAFGRAVRDEGLEAFVAPSSGRGVGAACGQLAGKLEP